MADKKDNKKKTKEEPVKKDDDDSDLENLIQVSQKYKQTRAAQKLKQKDESFFLNMVENNIPIKKKEVDPKVTAADELQQKWAQASNTIIKNPEQGSNAPYHQASTTHAIQQTLNLGIFDKSESGAYKIPLQQHKNFPHAIRLYIGNLPDNFDKEDFMKFIQQQMEFTGASLESGNPLQSIQPQLDKKFLFAQFRSIEEATLALNLDGINYYGKQLRIKRVKDFDNLPKVEGERPLPKVRPPGIKVSNVVSEGPLKVYITGFGFEVEEDYLMNVLSKYGTLKGLQIARDKASNISKGYGFAEFSDETEVERCISQLNNKLVDGRQFIVKRGNQDTKSASQPHQIDTITIQEQQEWDQKLTVVRKMKLSSVIRMFNMIKPSEIENDQEYYFVKHDIRREMEKIGKLVSFLVPRLKDGHQRDAVGKVFCEFEHENYAIVAYLLLQDKMYDKNKIAVEFYDAKLYADKVY